MSKYIVKTIYIEKSKRLIICDGFSTDFWGHMTDRVLLGQSDGNEWPCWVIDWVNDNFIGS